MGCNGDLKNHPAEGGSRWGLNNTDQEWSGIQGANAQIILDLNCLKVFKLLFFLPGFSRKYPSMVVSWISPTTVGRLFHLPRIYLGRSISPKTGVARAFSIKFG